MPTTENISSNYAGIAAQEYFSAVLKSPSSIVNGGVEFVDGIQFKWNIPRVNLSDIIADATCDFTPVGTLDRNERVLTLKSCEVNHQLCKTKYRVTWDNMPSSRMGGLAPSFAEHLLGLVAANVAQSRENTIWKGSAGNTGEFDGFETLFTNEPLQPAAYEIAGVALTAANIVEELRKVIDASSSALYDSDGFAIRISTKARKLYIQSQATLGYLDRYNVDAAPLNFEGVPLIHCSGLSDDVMFATYANNLFYGTGEAQDAVLARLLDQTNVDGSDNVNIVMQWADAVQVANPEDVITYGVTNTGN